jgi:hypothetical protein
MGLKQVFIWIFAKYIGFLAENLDFRSSHLEKKEITSTVVRGYKAF